MEHCSFSWEIYHATEAETTLVKIAIPIKEIQVDFFIIFHYWTPKEKTLPFFTLMIRKILCFGCFYLGDTAIINKGGDIVTVAVYLNNFLKNCLFGASNTLKSLLTF